MLLVKIFLHLLPTLCIGLKLCSKTVSWVDVTFAYSCTATTAMHKYLIWSHCNQQCDHEDWNVYISHCWHTPLYKYACQTTHV